VKWPGTAVVLAGALTLCSPGPAGSDPSKQRLEEVVDPIVARPELRHATWGVEVRSLETGDVLYALNAEKGMRPASTLKLLTTAAALEAFGPDARLLTTVETTARIDGWGRVLGDVWLVGRGDPSLSPRFDDASPLVAFEGLARDLAGAGVTGIVGRLIGHEGTFAGDRRGLDWMREDLWWGYGAEVSALTFHDNAVRVNLRPGEEVGDPAVIHVEPRTHFVEVVSSVLTGPAGTERDVDLQEPPRANHFQISGILPRDREWEGELAVEDPALFAANAFAEVLQARGIPVEGGVSTSSDPLPDDVRTIAAFEGEPLGRLIQEVNKESLNLHAELLLRRLGLHAFSEGTVEKGREAVLIFLEQLGVPLEGFRLKDGSGLSHTNVLTARGLVSLLVAMDRHVQRDVFRASLAVAGQDGTLEERMRGTPAEGRVLAKSGGLQSVSALAGYVTTARGESLAFAAFVNGHVDLQKESSSALDDLAVALATAR